MMLISTIYVELRVECSGTSVPVCTVPDVLLRTAPYCTVLVCTVQYCNGTVPRYVSVREGYRRADMGSSKLRDAILLAFSLQLFFSLFFQNCAPRLRWEAHF